MNTQTMTKTKTLVPFESLKGKILLEINVIPSENYKQSDKIIFKCTDGTYEMYYTDSFEEVSIDSIEGELSNLIGSEILLAEEVQRDKNEPVSPQDEYREWTFYKLATQKGHVDIRWIGEDVSFYAITISLFKVS